MKRLLLTGLLLAATAYAAVPLVLPTDRDWLAVPLRALGAGLVLVTLVAYALLARRGAALAPDDRGFRLRPPDVGLLVALPLYVIFVGNGLLLNSADNVPAIALGPLLLEKGTIELSSVPFYQQHRRHYSAIRVDGRILPAFPLGTGFLSVPYAAAARLLQPEGDPEVLAERRDKHLSALLMVASATMLFLGVRHRFGEGPGLATAVLFSLGTTAFSCGSQSLWTTTGEVFFLTMALALLLRRDDSVVHALLAGLAVGGAFACRPTAALTGCALAVVLLGRWPALAAYGVAAGAAIGAIALVLMGIYGHPLGGYGMINQQPWGRDLVEGLAGMLYSPSRGLLPFFPYVLFVPLGLPALRSDPRLARVFVAAFAATTFTYLLASGYYAWWGGKSLGPRLMTEAAPFLSLLLLPAFRRWRELGRARAALAITVALAVTTQLLSTYTTRGDVWSARANLGDPVVRWSIGDSQLVALWCPSCAPAAPER
jgi:hypothetical protein